MVLLSVGPRRSVGRRHRRDYVAASSDVPPFASPEHPGPLLRPLLRRGEDVVVSAEEVCRVVGGFHLGERAQAGVASPKACIYRSTSLQIAPPCTRDGLPSGT